jgi:hypothetical protein
MTGAAPDAPAPMCGCDECRDHSKPDTPTAAPARIYIETEPYDFDGYSPCWVWHGADALEEGTDGLVEYVRADLAQVEALKAENAECWRNATRIANAAAKEAEALRSQRDEARREAAEARAVIDAAKAFRDAWLAYVLIPACQTGRATASDAMASTRTRLLNALDTLPAVSGLPAGLPDSRNLGTES